MALNAPANQMNKGAGGNGDSRAQQSQGAGTSKVAGSGKAPVETNPGLRAAAQTALANAKAAMSAAGAKDLRKVQITETRRFAGREIEVTRLVEQDSKEAAEAAKKAAQAQSLKASGLDSLLSQYQKKKNVSVLDKTRIDWQQYKKTADGVEEELEEYKKSDKRYLDKVAFLKDAELRQYEKERDARLAADVRTRGRL